VYFDRELNVWHVSAAGGRPQRVTQQARGFIAFESLDGKALIYQDKDQALVARPFDGGPIYQLVPCVHGMYFAVGAPAFITPAVVMVLTTRFTCSTPRRVTIACLVRAAHVFLRPPGSLTRRQNHSGTSKFFKFGFDVDRELPVSPVADEFR
jgi:hypothetical protein